MFDEMEFGPDMWDKAFGVDKLNVYFKVHVDGMEGIDVIYSVYFKEPVTEENISDIANILADYQNEYETRNSGHIHYIDVTKEGENKLHIFVDFGSAEPDAMKEVIELLNDIKGIESVIMNEGLETEF